MSKFKTIIFPVAGLGTRMAPISRFIPKEMLPILDKPIIHFSIQEAIEAGFEKLVFIVRPGKEIIQKYVNEIFPEVNAVFISQESQKGLGHAVLCAESEINSNFAVSLPDDVIIGANPFSEMLDIYKSGNVVAAIEISADEAHKYGILNVKNMSGSLIDVDKLVEKPKEVNNIRNFAVIGRYLLDKEIFNFLKNAKLGTLNEIQLSDAIDQMILNGFSLSGCIFSGKRLDCGNMNGFVESLFSILFEQDCYRKIAKDLLEIKK